ncbi:Ig-like domain-containing protein [Ruminiclostridium papyrosolvens DSM 2782]|uniref:Ig-like domain-containing protein n=1 Tax=Ruminiclostridium papyrosolvens TaxID=29362 RepID=UPI0001B26631|nr:Ig-like domain-containing protein [Ruminiclostridium papyrosolvens]WES33262.1 Ig-like domain-containing protein [Ruminiclostridium papyrosolvens DSM 2782]
MPITGGTSVVNNNTGSGTTTPSQGDNGSNGNNGGGTPAPVKVNSISVSPESMTLIAGEATGTITATISPSNATNKNIIWSSSNKTVATVNNGIVTPLAEGTTIISAVSADDSAKRQRLH